MKPLLTKRALVQIWTDAPDCNLMADWRMDYYELPADLETFAEGLPVSNLEFAKDEAVGLKDADKVLKRRLQAAFLADGSQENRREFHLSIVMNQASLWRNAEFLKKAEQHLARKCEHYKTQGVSA